MMWQVVREALIIFLLLFYGILPKGGWVLADPKVLSHFFFCPEAIKSKQMPMCQKAENSEKVIFEIFCKGFLEKVTQKGVRPFWKNSIKSNFFRWMASLTV